MSSNGTIKGLIGVAGSGTAMLPTTQSVNFGVKTRSGYGEADLQYSGTGTLSIASQTNSAGASNVWTINSRNRLVPAGTYGSATLPVYSGPYTVVITDGSLSSTVTVNMVAQAAHASAVPIGTPGVDQDFSYGTTTLAHQLQVYLTSTNSSAGMALGDTIWCRSSDLGVTSSKDARIRPPAAGWLPGTGGRVTVRSEKPDSGTDALGFSRRQHGFRVGRLTIDVQAAATDLDTKLDFVDIHFIIDVSSTSTKLLNTGTGAGKAIKWRVINCRIENGPLNTTPQSSDGIKLTSGCSAIDCYFVNLGKALTAVNSNLIQNNDFRVNNEDCIYLSGQSNTVQDNFAVDFRFSTGNHPDFIQHSGNTSGGTWDFGIVRRNIAVRNDTTSGVIDFQGIFADDSTSTSRLAGAVIENNIVLNTMANGIYLNRFTNPAVRFNTVVNDLQGNSGGGASQTTILVASGKEGSGGVVSHNIANAIALGAQNATISTPNYLAATRTVAAYRTAMDQFPDQAAAGYVPSLYSREAVKSAVKPLAAGASRNPDGTYNGAILPNGAWNSGVVFD